MVERNRHLYSVGDVCGMTGVTRKTLFYYDRIGLLKPAVREGSQHFKFYDDEHINRLQKIIKYRNAGLCIAEIRELLDSKNADALHILEGALKRLKRQRNDTAKEICRLNKLIAETRKQSCR